MNTTTQQTLQDTSLVVLAAGLGSRFGGDKQLAGLGPEGMPLMYYNLLDAYTAGIRHAVLILREELVAVVKREFLPHLPGDIHIELAVQAIDDLPAGHHVARRDKPWGTGHALWSARANLRGPFITVNADDYYGAGALQALVNHCQGSDDWALVCYTLASTLSPHGGVNRGLCHLQDGYLVDIAECMQIQRTDNRLQGMVGNEQRELQPSAPVSMSLWAFTPTLFEHLEQGLDQFLGRHGGDPRQEFLLPDQVLASVNAGTARVRAYLSEDRWLGITYPQDLALVDAALKARVTPGN